jgi:hypothetical protein
MRIKLKPVPRPLFDPFNGLDEERLAEIEARRAKRCERGSRRDPKTGKCVVKHTRKAVR